MSRGGLTINGKSQAFGFFGFDDWLKSVVLSFPAPWSVMDPDPMHLHYGTHIQDSRGFAILTVWLPFGKPSQRSQDGMTDEEWKEYCCDNHWESAAAFSLSHGICAIRNAIVDDSWSLDEDWDRLRNLIVASTAEWSEDIWEEVRTGGPLKRLLPSDPEIADRPWPLGQRRPVNSK